MCCKKKHTEKKSAPCLRVSEGATRSNLHQLPCHAHITCTLVPCTEHYECVSSVASRDCCLSFNVAYEAAGGAPLWASEGKWSTSVPAAFCVHFHYCDIWLQNDKTKCSYVCTNTHSDRAWWMSCLLFTYSIQFPRSHKNISFLKRWIHVCGVWQLLLFVL